MSFGVARRLIDLALRGAARAFRADADIVIQRQPVVGVLQDRGKGLQKAPRPVLNVEVLDVIADRQSLAFDNFRLFRDLKIFLALFGS